MRSVGVRELKQNASGVVADAAAGEEITITVRGRAVARLVPLVSGLDRLVASGRVRPPTRSLADLPTPVPLDAGPTLSEVVELERDER